MAVVYQTEEEEKKKLGEAQGQGVLSQGNVLGQEPDKNLTTGGGEGSIVQGSGGASPAQRQGGTASGAYTNLQAYLDANKTDDIGGRIAGQIQGEADQARQAQATAGQGFRQKVDASRVGMDQSLLDKIKTDARAVAGSEADKTAFAKMRDAQYKGPSSLTETEDLFNPAYKETKEAEEKLNAMKSLEGRKAYLKQQSGPQYSKGMAKLDNLLLQNDPNARKSFQDLSAKNADIGSNYEKLLSELGDYAGKAKSETEGAKKAALESLSSGLGAQNKKTDERLKSRLAEIDQAENYRKMMETGDFSGLSTNSAEAQKRALELFGITSSDPTYNVDPTQYLSTVGRDQLSADTVRNADEAAILKALGELGGDVSGVNLDAAGLFDDEKLFDFQRDQYQGARRGGEKNMEERLSNQLRPIDSQIKTEETAIGGAHNDIKRIQDEMDFMKARNPNYARSDHYKDLQGQLNERNAYIAQHTAALQMFKNNRGTMDRSVRGDMGYNSRFKF